MGHGGELVERSRRRGLRRRRPDDQTCSGNVVARRADGDPTVINFVEYCSVWRTERQADRHAPILMSRYSIAESDKNQ